MKEMSTDAKKITVVELKGMIEAVEKRLGEKMASLEAAMKTLTAPAAPATEGKKERTPKLDADGNAVTREPTPKQAAWRAIQQSVLSDGTKVGVCRKLTKEGAANPRYAELRALPAYRAYVLEYGEPGSRQE